jgi:outer membrane protein OmpA-like peptidoglycan-associated protein/outer membrane protein W
MNFRKALVAATILALPLAAKAQPITGLYIGGGGGANIMQNEDAKVGTPIAPGTAVSGQLKTRVGPAVDLDVGYGLGNGLRAEIEGSYRYNTFYGPSGGVGVGGQEQKYGAMVNVLYDFVGMVPFVQPYVGVGGGYQWAQDRNLYVTEPGIAARARTRADGKIAYQGIVGVAFPVPNAPGLALTADYRFLGLVGHRNYPGEVDVAGVGVAPANIRLNNDFNHTILIGFRYAFGAAPAPLPSAPPAGAVPPSPVSRSYLVFFDWDKADLTDRARQIVSEAAANSTKVQYTRLEVNGYTDTSGTPKYNQGLSVRRAQAVAAELVKDGVPKTAITIQGFGETHLLVPTGPGVREPQNRRVEIIIK